MFKSDSFLGNKKLSLNQNVWRDHATMQLFRCLPLWTTVRVHGKKLQNATKQITYFHCTGHSCPYWRTTKLIMSQA